MYVITSNTSNDIVLDVIKDGKSTKVHLTNKFDTVESEELTNKIIYLDSKEIVRYAEVEDQPDQKSESKPDNQNSSGRGRRQNQAPEKSESTVTDDSDSKSDDKPDDSKSKEGGK